MSPASNPEPALKSGLYRLTQDVRPSRVDRRRTEWFHKPVLRQGMRFQVRWRSHGDRTWMEIRPHRGWDFRTSEDAGRHHCNIVAEILPYLEKEDLSLDEILTRAFTSDAVLRKLVETGAVTLEQLDTLFPAVAEPL